MVHIPVKFINVAAAFDEVDRVKLCERSGSKHSHAAQSFTDLSHLVKLFLEGNEEADDQEEKGINQSEGEPNCSEYQMNDVMKSLLDIGDDIYKRMIHSDVEKALLQIGKSSSPDFKSKLMIQLRDKGLDAGLCKSKWEKNGRCLPGSYEYIDVMLNGTRYIIEVSLAQEFEIARATSCYTSALENFPQIYVGKENEVKEIVKVMCNAISTSMKREGLHVPPWRKLAYMQAKWFASYKRTANEVPCGFTSINFEELSPVKRSVGFAPVLSKISSYCRQNFETKLREEISNLAIDFNDSEMYI